MRTLQIFLAALAVRTATAFWIQQPGYMDSYYYYAIAESLYNGQGFVENFVWNYLSIPSGIPRPSNQYWMPLASVAIALFFFIFGESFRAAQVPMILVSAILPVMSYHFTKNLLVKERYALSAAALTIFSIAYFVYWILPETFGLFAVFGALCLYLTSKGMRGSKWYFVAAGAVSGLAHLTRADGALLAPVVVLMCIVSIVQARHQPLHRAKLLSVPASIAAYLIVLSPWLWRNSAAFGQMFPSSGLKAAFLREYNDMFAYGHSVDLAYYLDSGWMEILRTKFTALAHNFLTFDLIAQVYLLPFLLVGWWQLRRRAEFLPVFAYTLSLYALVSLVFTHPGPRGTFLHSATAILPFTFGPAIIGLDRAIEFIARFRTHWSVPTAQRNFTYMLVGLSVILSLIVTNRAIPGWDDHYRLYRQVASWTESRVPAEQTVMVVDPPAYYYVTKRPSVVFTNDGLPELVDLARRFRVSYVVLEPAYPEPLHGFYAGTESHPALELEETFPDKDGKLIKIFRVVLFSQ